MSNILIKNGTIVTMDSGRRVFKGDIYIEGGKLARIEEHIDETNLNPEKVIDAENKVVIPGLIQTHIHLTQTMFRGFSDDLELLDWLKKRIWPLEASHTGQSNYYSAQLGIAELIKGGTTSIVDMETVNHTDEAIEAIYQSGIRAMTGKCMMDCNTDVPMGLKEDVDLSIKESIRLLNKWHMKDNGRIRYAFNPRFVVSCSDELLKKVSQLAKEYDVFVHTHASENRGEIELVEKERGMRNIVYLDKIGLTGEKLILAHCIWLDEEEVKILKGTGTRVSHCPSSNMKLASGIAKIPELIDEGIVVSIGADGAPCNNNLDIFKEMRTACLLQKVRLLSPTVLPAAKVFELATIDGARVMGMEKEIGSLEVGKKADVVIMDLNKIHILPSNYADIVSSIVYSANSTDVETVLVDGKILMENRRLLTLNESEIVDNITKTVKSKQISNII